jgi:uncharacterized membrane protein
MVELEQRNPSRGKASRNERRKAVATVLNALAVAVFISAFFQPLVSGGFNLGRMVWALCAFLVFQALLHYVLSRVED